MLRNLKKGLIHTLIICLTVTSLIILDTSEVQARSPNYYIINRYSTLHWTVYDARKKKYIDTYGNYNSLKTSARNVVEVEGKSPDMLVTDPHNPAAYSGSRSYFYDLDKSRNVFKEKRDSEFVDGEPYRYLFDFGPDSQYAVYLDFIYNTVNLVAEDVTSNETLKKNIESLIMMF